jgi:hypothetical protein
MKCEKCESCNLIEGHLHGGHGMGFIPKGRKSILSLIGIYATACKDCGHIFDFKLDKSKLHKLK